MQLEKLYHSSAVIESINFDVISSMQGIREIRINSTPTDYSKAQLINIKNDASEMLGIFNQLKKYFNNELQQFKLLLEIIGTEFQKKVWGELSKIKYGSTISYKELAIRVGDIKSIRAVGKANAVNPLPIVIPCHRVIGANGKLVGYGGGINVKEKLLRLEGSLQPGLFT